MISLHEITSLENSIGNEQLHNNNDNTTSKWVKIC